MSYTALYRKFRPDNFDDVKGQEPIITTLRNQIKTNRIGHAYLFCGTRGTGKTTVAKIFAKVVNCEAPIDGNPCNSCEVCNRIINNNSFNVIEIDAASNNGVDSIRKIVDEVKYSPTEGKYKVYIIDEVHMLSVSAFNALLKTLEEPPSYVIFILATTEIHKIPVTVLSRCQRFDFKRISIEKICDRLKELATHEDLEIEEKALQYIARMADGALRDALSLLDQCISYNIGEKLTYDNVLKALGAVDITIFSELLKGIKGQQVNQCIELIDRIELEGRELGQFTTDFIWYLRNILLIQASESIGNMLEISSEDLAVIKEDSKLFDKEIIMRYIRVFSDLAVQIRYAPRKRVMLEVTIIKLVKPQSESSFDALINRIAVLEDKLEKGIIFSINNSANEEKVDGYKPESEVIVKKEILPEAVPEDLKEAVRIWQQIINKMSKNAPILSATLKNVKVSINDKNDLLLITHNEVDYEILKREDNINIIKNTIEKQIRKSINISIKNIEVKKDEVDNYPDLQQIIKVPIEYID